MFHFLVLFFAYVLFDGSFKFNRGFNNSLFNIFHYSINFICNEIYFSFDNLFVIIVYVNRYLRLHLYEINVEMI